MKPYVKPSLQVDSLYADRSIAAKYNYSYQPLDGGEVEMSVPEIW